MTPVARKQRYETTPKCQHTPCPTGYMQWHYWAEVMARTHVQEKCPHCGRLAIWKRREKR
jgi:hypothetical protein